MTIGRRIALGYGILIAVTLIGGLVTVSSLLGVRQETTRLDTAYIPQMTTGSGFERSAWRLFFHMRGFDSDFAESELIAAREKFAEVQDELRTARELAGTQQLKEFAAVQAKAQPLLEQYATLIDATEAAVETMVGQREPLNDAAARFIEFCNQFMETQNEQLRAEVEDRQSAIILAQAVVSHGTQARVFSYEAQSSNNYDLFKRSESELNEALSLVEQLRARSRTEEGRESVARIEQAAQAYASAIQGYYAQVSDEENIDVMAMMQSRQEMDKAAEAFSEGTAVFLIRQNEELDASIADRLARISLASDVLEAGNAIYAASYRSQAAGQRDEMRRAVASFAELGQTIGELQARTSETNERAQLVEVHGVAKEFESFMNRYLAAWDQHAVAGNEREAVYQQILASAQSMAALGVDQAVEGASRNATSLARTSTISIAASASAVIFGVILGLMNIRAITRALRRVVKSLNHTSSSLSSASRQVTQASQELAEGSSQQAASVEETSSSLEELASMTRQNAEHAGVANTTVQATAKVVEEATEAMQELTESMKEIASGSKETQKIIKTIDEIAFQTNLLALNAAVEAARAGEAGAGFAVVADEVRNLAIRTADSARDTAAMIERSVQKIDAGSTILHRTNEAFSKVKTQTHEVRDLSASIATASGEQSNGIEQINKAVNEMDRVVQRNASGAEETASAANELTRQATTLNRVVQQMNSLIEASREPAKPSKSRRKESKSELGEGDIDGFDFEIPNAFDESEDIAVAVSPGPKVGREEAAKTTEGVIRGSEMHDFEIDESEFTFEDDSESFEAPKR